MENEAPYLFNFYYGQTTEARLWSRPKMLFTEVREYSYQHKLPPFPTLASLPVGPLGQEMTLRPRGVLLSPQSITRFQVVIPFRHSSLERPFLRLRDCLP